MESTENTGLLHELANQHTLTPKVDVRYGAAATTLDGKAATPVAKKNSRAERAQLRMGKRTNDL